MGDPRSRLISAIRESNSTQVGGATALGREFDRSIADELDAFDPEMMENLTVGVKGKKKKNKGGKSVRLLSRTRWQLFGARSMTHAVHSADAAPLPTSSPRPK